MLRGTVTVADVPPVVHNFTEGFIVDFDLGLPACVNTIPQTPIRKHSVFVVRVTKIDQCGVFRTKGLSGIVQGRLTKNNVWFLVKSAGFRRCNQPRVLFRIDYLRVVTNDFSKDGGQESDHLVLVRQQRQL